MVMLSAKNNKHGIILRTKTRDHAPRLLFKIAHKFKKYNKILDRHSSS